MALPACNGGVRHDGLPRARLRRRSRPPSPAHRISAHALATGSRQRLKGPSSLLRKERPDIARRSWRCSLWSELFRRLKPDARGLLLFASMSSSSAPPPRRERQGLRRGEFVSSPSVALANAQRDRRGGSRPPPLFFDQFGARLPARRKRPRQLPGPLLRSNRQNAPTCPCRHRGS